jgi:hypothetical protein
MAPLGAPRRGGSAHLASKGAAWRKRLGSSGRRRHGHQLVADRFGQFTITEYNKAVRTLVAEERIDRPTPKGIKDDEQLRFVSPPQQSMFG